MLPHTSLRYLRQCYRIVDLHKWRIRWLSLAVSRNCSGSDPKLDLPRGPSPPYPCVDHHTRGTSLEIFTTHPSSPGSPFFTPDGAFVFQKLQEFLRAQYPNYGLREVITPTIYKRSLWEISGHWEYHKNDMFHISKRGTNPVIALNTEEPSDNKQIGEDEEYSLKPMNCPGHCVLYKSQLRSWRDLPLRYADFSALHRNEISGALSDLTGVRHFHRDDGYIFCTVHQIQPEVQRTLDFVEVVYTTFKLPYKLVLSTRPRTSYKGEQETWHEAEYQLKFALEKSDKEWEYSSYNGGFYGPKIDIIVKDSAGKEHQTGSIQLDYQLPKIFGLEYQAGPPAHGMRRPVIIHRTILGSMERFIALLIKKYKGRWPFWLSPRQMMLCTVTTNHNVLMAAKDMAKRLSQYPGTYKRRPMSAQTFIVDVDDTPQPLTKKIEEAREKKYNLIGVFGERNLDDTTIDVDYSGHPNFQGTCNVVDEVLGRKTTIRGLQRTEDVMGLQGVDVQHRQLLNPGGYVHKAVLYRNQCVKLMRTLSARYM